MFKFLEGYKTYVLVFVLLVVNILHFKFHLISDEVAVPLYGVLIPAIIAALRHGMTVENDRIREEIKEEIRKSDS